MSETMTKMLSPHSSISQANKRSAVAELPRESRKLRTAETSAAGTSAGTSTSDGPVSG
jgi:hypothetical protein